MFNYVKAELWKLTQRPALFLTWGILFLLMVVYSVLLSGREYSNLVAACTVVLVAGVLMAPLLVVLVAIPGVVILGVLLAMIQRFREIEKGEAEDAKQY